MCGRASRGLQRSVFCLVFSTFIKGHEFFHLGEKLEEEGVGKAQDTFSKGEKTVFPDSFYISFRNRNAIGPNPMDGFSYNTRCEIFHILGFYLAKYSTLFLARKGMTD